MTSPLARFAEAMDARRLDLGLTWDEVSAESGVHRETIRAIRNRGTGSIRELTKRGLERALRWQTGSIDTIMSGGDPTPLEPGRPERTAEESLDRLEEVLHTPGGRAALRSAIAGLEAQLRVTEDREEQATLRRLIARLGGPLPREPEPDSTKRDKEAG